MHCCSFTRRLRGLPALADRKSKSPAPSLSLKLGVTERRKFDGVRITVVVSTTLRLQSRMCLLMIQYTRTLASCSDCMPKVSPPRFGARICGQLIVSSRFGSLTRPLHYWPPRMGPCSSAIRFFPLERRPRSGVSTVVLMHWDFSRDRFFSY